MIISTFYKIDILSVFIYVSILSDIYRSTQCFSFNVKNNVFNRCKAHFCV